MIPILEISDNKNNDTNDKLKNIKSERAFKGNKAKAEVVEVYSDQTQAATNKLKPQRSLTGKSHRVYKKLNSQESRSKVPATTHAYRSGNNIAQVSNPPSALKYSQKSPKLINHVQFNNTASKSPLQCVQSNRVSSKSRNSNNMIRKTVTDEENIEDSICYNNDATEIRNTVINNEPANISSKLYVNDQSSRNNKNFFKYNRRSTDSHSEDIVGSFINNDTQPRLEIKSFNNKNIAEQHNGKDLDEFCNNIIRGTIGSIAKSDHNVSFDRSILETPFENDEYSNSSHQEVLAIHPSETKAKSIEIPAPSVQKSMIVRTIIDT